MTHNNGAADAAADAAYTRNANAVHDIVNTGSVIVFSGPAKPQAVSGVPYLYVYTCRVVCVRALQTLSFSTRTRNKYKEACADPRVLPPFLWPSPIRPPFPPSFFSV